MASGEDWELFIASEAVYILRWLVDGGMTRTQAVNHICNQLGWQRAVYGNDLHPNFHDYNERRDLMHKLGADADRYEHRKLP